MKEIMVCLFVERNLMATKKEKKNENEWKSGGNEI